MVRATTISAVIFFVTSLSLAIFAKNQAGTGTTVGLPIVNQEILEETTASQTDIPTLVEEQQTPAQSDVPTLPNN